MISKIVMYLLPLACCINTAQAQTFDYNDTILHKGGEYFYTKWFRIYGQYRIDTLPFWGTNKNIRGLDVNQEFSDKILYGKCFFYWPRITNDSNGIKQTNDTTKIRMISYYNDSGESLKTIYFNKDGTVQYIYIRKEND